MDCEYKIPFPGVGVGCGYGTDMKPTCWLNTRRCNEDKCPLMVRGEKNMITRTIERRAISNDLR